jgi:hypothetical protein
MNCFDAPVSLIPHRRQTDRTPCGLESRAMRKALHSDILTLFDSAEVRVTY